MLPDRPPNDTSAAEVTMFEFIRDAKDLERCFCLHSLGIARHRRKDYAEADLIVVGPFGVFCLEVKGGHVVRRGGTWTIGWPGGKTYESKEGPFVQSEGVRWALLDFLNKHIGPNVRNEVLLGWGVAFPDVIFTQTGPEWDQEVIYDQRDKAAPFSAYLARLEAYFRRRLTETGRHQPPRLSPVRIAEIVDKLRGDFEIVPSMKGLLADSQQDLIRLSREQFAVLNFALNDRNPRIICEGAAGTGKTLIAMEAARRLSADGKKTLFLCFNDNLRRFLSADAADSGGRIRISSLHRFLGDMIRKAGLSARLATARASLPETELFEKAYPEIFESAASALLEEAELPQFDAIVVDEAQDVLNGPMLNCLDLVLDRGFVGGRWLLFMDTGLQADVYGRLDRRLVERLQSFKPVTFDLLENFRNPKGIVTEMCAVIGAPEPICRRELISKVEYVSFSNEQDQGRKLRALLLELLRQGVSPSQMTILSGRKQQDACVSRHPPDIGKPIVYLDSDGGPVPADVISAASVPAFKGLENEVLILTDLPPLEPMTPWARSIFYVGMTRAPDVGDGFGGKASLYPEEMTVSLLAHRFGRAVRWTGSRGEDLVSTTHGFDEIVDAELGLDRDGHILALAAEVIGDVGAYSIYPWTAAPEPVQVASFLPGPYRVPTYRGQARAVATCKTPTGPYRGVGRPISTFVMERLTWRRSVLRSIPFNFVCGT
jgi:hypothetical protein